MPFSILVDANGKILWEHTGYLPGDEAQMESYLNAWHKNPDLTVYYFLGTYISKARRLPEGWRIYDMTLRLDTSGTVQTS